MIKITSVNNANIKEIASLKDTAKRKMLGRYVIEGEVMLCAAADCGIRFETLVYSENYEGRLFSAEQELCVSAEVFRKISDTVTPQGVLAVVRQAEYALLPPTSSTYICDGVRDPGNLGTIIRCAAALGMQDLYLIGCVDPYNPKVLRATMSGIFFVRCHVCSAEDVVRIVKPTAQIVVADMEGLDLYSVPPPRGNVAIVIGNEAHGVSDDMRKVADLTVSIPMKNIESLNAAVSAAVLGYTLLNIH